LGIGRGAHRENTLSKRECGVECFAQAWFGFGVKGESVLNDFDVGGVVFAMETGREIRGGISVEAMDVAVVEDAEEALRLQESRDFFPGDFTGEGNFERDEDRFALAVLEEVVADFLGRPFPDGFAAFGTGQRRHAREEHFEIIRNLRHGADRGAGRADGVGLGDGDGGGDAFDSIDLGFVHAFEELPRVGGKGFRVTALAFGIESIKGERRFSGAAQAGDNNELAKGKIEAEVLEVVLTCAADGNVT